MSLVNWLNQRLARIKTFTNFPFLRGKHFSVEKYFAAHKFSSWKWKLCEKKKHCKEMRRKFYELKNLRVSCVWKLWVKIIHHFSSQFHCQRFSHEKLKCGEIVFDVKQWKINVITQEVRRMNESAIAILIHRWSGKCLFGIAFSFFFPQKQNTFSVNAS